MPWSQALARAYAAIVAAVAIYSAIGLSRTVYENWNAGVFTKKGDFLF